MHNYDLHYLPPAIPSLYFFFFFNDTATTEIYTLSLHDALPIYAVQHRSTLRAAQRRGRGHSARCRQGAGPAQHERLADASLAAPAGRRGARGLHAVRSTAPGGRDTPPPNDHPEHP